MLATLRHRIRILVALVCCLIILYALYLFKSIGILTNSNGLLHTNLTRCRWPPASSNDIRTTRDTFNITICIQEPPNLPATNSVATYPIRSLFRNVESQDWISYREMGECDPSICKQPIYPDVYRTYPQDVPIKSIITAIKSGSPVSEMPNYNFPMQILKMSESVCRGTTHHDLVVVVKSAVLNWERRKLFRAHMQRQRDLNPNTKVGFVFSLGLPRQHGGRIFNRDGHITILEGEAGVIMDEYIGRSSEVMEKIEQEMRQYDDIMLTDFEDTYFNLTWKTTTNLRWLSAFCDKVHNDVFMIMDDDHGINISKVMQFLASTPKEKKRTSLFGYIAKYDGVTRSPQSKLFLSRRELPWGLAGPYPRGFGMFIGTDIIDDMAIGSVYTRHNYILDDVYLGLLTFKLGIPLQHVDTMYGSSMKPRSEVMVAGLNYWNSI